MIEFELGCIYSSGDDAIYKVLFISADRNSMVLLHYSHNHKVFTPEVTHVKDDEYWLKELKLVEDPYYEWMFNNMDGDRLI